MYGWNHARRTGRYDQVPGGGMSHLRREMTGGLPPYRGWPRPCAGLEGILELVGGGFCGGVGLEV